MQAMKRQCKETNLCGVCLHFLCIVTIDHHRILNDKPCVERRHWLKVKLWFFFSKLNCVLFAQCIIFCRTNRAHWRSVIDSQLFMIKNKPRNSQRSKMTYLEDNFAISLFNKLCVTSIKNTMPLCNPTHIYHIWLTLKTNSF